MASSQLKCNSVGGLSLNCHLSYSTRIYPKVYIMLLWPALVVPLWNIKPHAAFVMTSFYHRLKLLSGVRQRFSIRLLLSKTSVALGSCVKNNSGLFDLVKEELTWGQRNIWTLSCGSEAFLIFRTLVVRRKKKKRTVGNRQEYKPITHPSNAQRRSFCYVCRLTASRVGPFWKVLPVGDGQSTGVFLWKVTIIDFSPRQDFLSGVARFCGNLQII